VKIEKRVEGGDKNVHAPRYLLHTVFVFGISDISVIFPVERKISFPTFAHANFSRYAKTPLAMFNDAAIVRNYRSR